ncbi:hypothetical protein FHX82_001816 [Amycolatopsis bartoniae]|uniref:Beta/gamma crystallin family protein n=1 Tax=Amycolatopsis bartoniae TaxID=941986 RepID=A0A8H9IVF0_9PSEU|nr:hypothetical protein [Amycolatopsis bartoniae]MBB2934796.1 hypothetical protein [Amycolatopsis bartoniae]TVT02418.1 hypothetical protein FNH07_27270 [Amycolatopsis bartoniae]GHF44673.1 hypothetical protein GCM10017566_17100 [Amycolatopsis bartoniae]
MLRRLVTGCGVALALFGGVAATSGLAQADTDPHEGGVAAGTWVFVKWYQGSNSMASFYQCNVDAQQQYPNHNYECRAAGDTLQLWVEY